MSPPLVRSVQTCRRVDRLLREGLFKGRPGLLRVAGGDILRVVMPNHFTGRVTEDFRQARIHEEDRAREVQHGITVCRLGNEGMEPLFAFRQGRLGLPITEFQLPELLK